MKYLTASTINRAIRHLGLRLIRGKGYFYFLDSENNQVGDSVMVFCLSQQSLERWVEEAEYARKQNT